MNKPPSEPPILKYKCGTPFSACPQLYFRKGFIHCRDQWKAANEKIVERLEEIKNMELQYKSSAIEELEQLIKELTASE